MVSQAAARPLGLRLGLGRLSSWIAPIALLALWEVFARAGLLPSYLPAPSLIGVQLVQNVQSGELPKDAAASLYRVAAGFVLGATAGTLLGLLSGVSRAARSFFGPLVSVSYPVPKIALLPVFMVWFGINDTSKIAVILLAVFYPAFLNAFYGAKAVPGNLLWAARNMGASPVAIFWRVVMPSAAPHVFGGVRIALALSFVLLFSAELVSSTNGLGYLIQLAEQYDQYDLMFVSIATIGVLGFAADRLLLTIRRRVLHYLPEARDAFG